MPMSSVRASVVRAHVRVASGGSSRTTREGYIRYDGGWASWSQEVSMECGEGKHKEGEENVFYVSVVQKQKSDREMHSVFFATHPAPELTFSHPFDQQPIVVHRAPAVRAVVWFRKGRWWRCL